MLGKFIILALALVFATTLLVLPIAAVMAAPVPTQTPPPRL
jgi:hypothetical protein